MLLLGSNDNAFSRNNIEENRREGVVIVDSTGTLIAGSAPGQSGVQTFAIAGPFGEVRDVFDKVSDGRDAVFFGDLPEGPLGDARRERGIRFLDDDLRTPSVVRVPEIFGQERPVLENSPGPAAADSANVPLVVEFDMPVVAVAMRIGAPATTTAMLRAYDVKGALLGTATGSALDTFDEFLAIVSRNAPIARVELDYGASPLPERILWITFGTFPGNSVMRNGSAGILLINSGDNKVQVNHVAANGGGGIVVVDSPTPNWVSFNHVVGNSRVGISVISDPGTDVVRNTVVARSEEIPESFGIDIAALAAEQSDEKGAAEIQGPVSVFGTGGPDGGGYRWIDISGTGEWLGISTCDDCFQEVPIGFEFNFYGENRGGVLVTTNGILTFDETNAWQYSNEPIPSPNAPHAIIAPFWDDLDPGEWGDIYYQTMGPVGDRILVVQWDGIAHYPGFDDYTFQVILEEGSNNIRFQYLDMIGSQANGNSATIGIEEFSGNVGLQTSFNAAFVENGLAVLIHREPPAPPQLIGIEVVDSVSNHVADNYVNGSTVGAGIMSIESLVGSEVVRAEGETNANTATSVTPAVVRHEVEGSALNILVYTDDAYNSPGNTFVEQALLNLGLPFVSYYADPFGFCERLVGDGPWDMVLVSHNTYFELGQCWNELEDYSLGGGLLKIETFDADLSHSESTSLFETLGVQQAWDNSSAEPVYRWEPGHPLFDGVPDLFPYFEGYNDNGDGGFDVEGPAPAIGGYTTTRGPVDATIFVRRDGRAIVDTFIVSEIAGDYDEDGMVDGVELWMNQVKVLLKGVTQLGPGEVGIWLRNDANATVERNDVTGNLFLGIGLKDVNDSVVRGNFVHENGNGIGLVNTPPNGGVPSLIEKNTIVNNVGAPAGFGSVLSSAYGNPGVQAPEALQDLPGGIGIMLFSASNDNVVRANWVQGGDIGILVVLATENLIGGDLPGDGNTVVDHEVGIALVESGRNRVVGNLVEGTVLGVLVVERSSENRGGAERGPRVPPGRRRRGVLQEHGAR